MTKFARRSSAASGGGLDMDSGAPARPKGESVAGHPRVDSGGRKPGALANSGRRTGTNTEHVESTAGGSGEPRKVVRATMRLRIYPSLSEDPKALWGELDTLRRQSVHAANAALRAHWRADTDALDGYLAEHSQPPRKAKDFPAAIVNGYRIVRNVAPELASGALASAISQDVYKYWKKWRWDTLVKCKRQPPLFRDSRPIPIRAAEIKVQPREKHWAINVQLWSGSNGRRDLPVRARDAREIEALQALSSGDWRCGNAAIQWDERKRRYYIRISYTKLVDPVPVTERTAAIQRGIRQFLVVTTYDGEDWIDAGHDIVEHRRRSAARRRQIQSSVRASRRRRRGRKRALQAIRTLQDKTTRWRDTRTQQLARHAVDWLRRHDIHVLYVEDFRDIRRYCEEQLGERIAPYVHDWRYDDLQRRIVACAEESGMHVVQVPAEWISRTCPRCEADAEPDLSRWRLRCPSCKYGRDLDIAASMNLRLRGERFGGVVLVGDKSLGKSDDASGHAGTARKAGRTRPKSRESWETGRRKG